MAGWVGRKIFLKLSCLLIASLIISGCSAGFILRSAYEQSKILLNRESITKAINSPEISAEDKRKLELVLKAREFAEQMGLKPKGSFKTYSRIDRETLVWVVAGARKTEFALHTWWFPIVGSVPYKGFFHKSDAIRESDGLKRKGYETFVRGADALSTLGWFDDPVLTPMLRNPDHQIVSTVIHETVHSTVWIPDHVPFNESLANFVGLEATEEFYISQKDLVGLKISKRQHHIENALSKMISALFEELNNLYSKNISDEEKLKQRRKIFLKHVSPFKRDFPEFKALSEPNNAEILQLKFYLTNLRDFEALYRKSKSWQTFFAKIEEIAESSRRDSSVDPFKLLQDNLK
jgi:predicted aminopeptidase